MPSKTVSPTIRRVLLSVPLLEGNEWTYVKQCLDTAWVSSVGAFVERLEKEIASYTGAPYAVAVVNATAGLHLALQVVGVEPGDAVIVSDLTFVAPVAAIRQAGAVPIFMDADPTTWQLDTAKLKTFLETECELRSDVCIHKASGKRVQAILAVHILGASCAMDQILKLADHYHLRVVEDAAEALGVRYQGRHAGTFGDIGVFSFNGNKVITTGGGGLVVTSRSDLAAKAKHLSTTAKNDETEYIHDEVGYNYRLTNIQAALGVAQMEKLNTYLERKRSIASRYEAGLKQLPGLTLMPRPKDTDSTFWLYTVLLPEATTLQKRKEFIGALHQAGVEARPLWHPIHSLKPYASYPNYQIRTADRLYQRGISLPSSVGLTTDDQDYCIATFEKTFHEWK